jgi:hypothetical protein
LRIQRAVQTEPRRSLWIFIAAVRLLFVFVYRIDSDEPQHLHVVWAWSQGLAPYREVFDNHLPLLHLLFAPVMRFVPQGSAVFLIMRLAIAPIAFAAAWLLFKFGEPLIGRPQAAIAALTFCVLPPWLPKSIEFRNDTLWIFFWLAALVLITARRTPALVAGGVAGGFCLLASEKAVPLLLAHVAALISQRYRPSPKAVLRLALGALIPLVAVAAFLYARGSLDAFFFATQRFNVLFPVPIRRRVVRGIIFVLVAPLLLSYGRDRSRELPPLVRHLLLVALWYSFAIFAFCPIISPRDFLPLVPLASLAIGATNVARRAPAAILGAGILAAVWYGRLWQAPNLTRERFVDAVVRTTAADDYVFDLKGDAIFRRRPVYFIYERVGRVLTGNGTIPDRGPEEIAARGCCAAIADSSHIPPRTRAFLNRHFIDFGLLRVCGATANGDTFTIGVPQLYSVIARDPAGVTIDGLPYRGPRFLAAGEHTLMKKEREPVTIIWSRAAQTGQR